MLREINDVTGWRAAELGVPLHFGLRLIWSTAGISMAGETLLELAKTNMLKSVDVGGDCDGLGYYSHCLVLHCIAVIRVWHSLPSAV